MSNLGAYQLMTTVAKEAGGVEEWINSIKRAAYNSGAKDMRNKMFAPLLLSGLGLGIVGVHTYQKVKLYFAGKKEAATIEEKSAIAEELLKNEIEAQMEKQDTTI